MTNRFTHPAKRPAATASEAEDHPDHRLDRHLDHLQGRLPGRIAGWIARLREPRARWLRIPLSVALIVGGCLGFLPILGFWMLPAGLLLLSLDIPPLKIPTVHALDWLVRCRQRWQMWKLDRNAGET